MNESIIRQQMEIAKQLVQTWPAWKRNILIDSSQPTVLVARSPVNNQSTVTEEQKSGK